MNPWQLLLHASIATAPTTALVCFVFRKGYLDAPLSYLLSLITAGIAMTRWHPDWGKSFEDDRFLEIMVWPFYTPWMVLPALTITFLSARRVFR